MGTGYTRNDTANNIADGNIINAADLDGEFDAIESAFNSSTGHTHDGTSAEGGAILVLGPSQEFVASSTEVKPSANAGLSLGTSLLQFNDLYVDGKAYIDGLGESILVDTNSKIQFRDTALFINSSADGQLDIEADTTLKFTVPSAVFTDNVFLKSDASILHFGADNDVTLTHVADTGLDLKSSSGFVLNLQTSDTTVESGTVLGRITFNAPDEASGTDAITVGAAIEAHAEATFDSATNTTGLLFKTGTSGAAIERMRLTGAGDLHFKDSRKAIFGDGSDLQIWHSGTSSYISENSSAGALLIQGEELVLENPDGTNYFRAATDGSVKLYNSGAVKLSTASDGLDVTGTIDIGDATDSMGATLDINGNQSGATDRHPALWTRSKVGASIMQFNVKGGQFEFGSGSTLDTTPMVVITNGGNVGIGGEPTQGITNATTLHIKNSTTNYSQLRLTNSTSGHAALSGFEIHTNGTDGFINNREDGDIHFYANGGHKASIMSSGRFGIGTESPQTMLEVEADSGASDGSVSAPVAIRITDTLSSQGSTTDVTNNYGELQFFSRDTSNEGPIIQASIGAKYDDVYAAGSDLTFSTWNAGLASPEERLRINSIGDLIIKNSSYNGTLYTETAGSGNLRIGHHAGDAITSGGNNNTFYGDYAGTSVTEGDNNVAIGGDALQNSVTNSNNTIMGRAAGYNLAGSNNTAVGFNAMYGTSGTATGSYNVALGYQSLYDLTDGTHNQTMGYRSAFNLTAGDNNVAIGNQALYTGTNVGRNMAIGTNALYYATTSGNIGIGHAAAQDMTTGASVVAIGDYAGTNLTAGSYTVAIGANASYTQTTAVGTVAVGYEALYTNNAGSYNVAVGHQAAKVSDGTSLTAVGGYALHSNTTGYDNDAFGRNALYTNTTGYFNVALGSRTLENNTGNNNTAVGRQALRNNSTASGSVAVGATAGWGQTTGQASTNVGYGAGYSNQTGNYNTNVGYEAGYSNSSSYATAIGYQALRNATTGGSTAVGHKALFNMSTGTDNVAVGGEYNYHAALKELTTGVRDTAVGVGAGWNNTTGSYNTYLGTNAGRSNTISNYNTFLGYNAGYYSTGEKNTFVGNAGIQMTTGSSNTILGSFTGNQDSLDIRAHSQAVVLSDGDGNPVYHKRNNSNVGSLVSTGISTVIAGPLGITAGGATATASAKYMMGVGIDNSANVNVDTEITSVSSEWRPLGIKVTAISVNTNASSQKGAWWFYKARVNDENVGGISLVDSGGDTSSFTLSISDQNSAVADRAEFRVALSNGGQRTYLFVEAFTYDNIIAMARV